MRQHRNAKFLTNGDGPWRLFKNVWLYECMNLLIVWKKINAKRVASGHQTFIDIYKKKITTRARSIFVHLEKVSKVCDFSNIKKNDDILFCYLSSVTFHPSVLTCSIIDGDLLDVCVWALGARLEGPDERVHGRPGDQGPHNPPTLLQSHPNNLTKFFLWKSNSKKYLFSHPYNLHQHFSTITIRRPSFSCIQKTSKVFFFKKESHLHPNNLVL